ncbi:synaptic vesicle 2-related protein-like [Schistocerca americana]|uniref:synaptic vesicle 2-related protein-like n=1 Tax=Schistocerca americana TaxID=7009 RepID=UPI001F4F6604|nr:synaptic vesicle 2-related protein-like [Schistocerca americana]
MHIQINELGGVGRFHYVLVTVCGFCLISMIFESLAAAYVTPAAQCDFDMTSFEKGFLSGTIYVGMIVSSHLWGFVADTRGRRQVLLVTLALNFVCSVAAALMPTLPLLIFFRFLNGVWICGPSAVTYAYLGEFHSDKTRTQAIVYVCIFLSMALLVEPGLAWVLILQDIGSSTTVSHHLLLGLFLIQSSVFQDWFEPLPDPVLDVSGLAWAVIPQPWAAPLPWITMRSWRVFLILGAVPSAATFLGLWLLLPESPKFLLAVGRHDEALDVLRKMFATNSGLPPQKYPVAALQGDALTSSPVGVNTKSPLAIARHMWRQTVPLFKPPYLLYTVVACFIQFGLYASSNGFLIWLPELLNRMGQYGEAYPNHPATVCDVIAVLAGQLPPPVTVELLQANYSSVTESYTAAEDVIVSNWTVELLSAERGANWTSTVPDAMASNLTSWVGDVTTGAASLELPPALEVCVATVNPVSFQNTLITGAGFAVSYIAISPIIKVVSKKTILAVCLTVSGACGVAVLWAQTDLEVLLLPMAFIVLSGMCVSVVNVVVVDTVPTYLRAMAVCLSLCFGRLGTFITSLMLGALIDSNCVLAIAILGGYVVACGLASTLLPSEAKLKELRG